MILWTNKENVYVVTSGNLMGNDRLLWKYGREEKLVWIYNGEGCIAPDKITFFLFLNENMLWVLIRITSQCVSNGTHNIGFHGEVRKITILIQWLLFLIWVLWLFQEYFTYIELIFHQRWAKTGEPREKPPDIRKQNLAFPHVTRARLEPQQWET